MYQKNKRGLLKHFDFALLDELSLFVSFIVAFFVRFGSINGYPSIFDSMYLNMLYIYLLADLGVLSLLDTLQNVLKRNTAKELYVTVRHSIILALIGSFYLYTSKIAFDYSRLLFIYTMVCYFIVSLLVRLVWKYILLKIFHGSHKKSMLVFTTRDLVDDVSTKIKEFNFSSYKIIAIVLADEQHVDETMDDIKVLGIDDNVIDILNFEWVDEVLVNVNTGETFPEEIINKCILAGITVHTCLTRLDSVKDKKQFVSRVGSYDVITTTSNYLTPKQALWKRFIDILGGLVGCLITLLICIFVGPIIFFSDPGSIFFAQERIGLNGKRFKIYKFRSMYKDAEARKKELMAQNKVEDGMMFKMDFDPRIIGNKELPNGKQKTGIGQFIRATSLDEFPQFFNVLKGDMSIVGTRPPTVDEWEKYEMHHRSRLATKPGITGMWQVSGRSDITDFEEVIRLDNEYISNWTIWLDFKLIFKTVAVVLKREGSM